MRRWCVFSVSFLIGCILVLAGYRKALDTLIEGCFSFILLQRNKERINKKMKTIIKSTLSIVLALLLALCIVACDKTDTEEPDTATPDTSTPEAPADDGKTDDGNTVNKTGVWESATYLKDMQFGEGAKTLTVTVKAENQSVTFTVKTDKTTVGAALLEHSLIVGEDSQYGLYIKKVNGISADYDTDRYYWAFYVNGEYAMGGVDTTEIVEGATYSLEYTK